MKYKLKILLISMLVCTNIQASFLDTFRMKDDIFVFIPNVSEEPIEWQDALVYDTVLRTIDSIGGFKNIYVENFFDSEHVENSLSYSQLSNLDEEHKKQFVNNKNINFYIQWEYENNDKKSVILYLFDNSGKVINKVPVQRNSDVEVVPIQEGIIQLFANTKKINLSEIVAIKEKYTFKKFYASMYYAKGLSNYIRTYDILTNSAHKAAGGLNKTKQKMLMLSKQVISVEKFKDNMISFDNALINAAKKAIEPLTYDNKHYSFEGIDAFKKSLEIEESAQAHISLSNLLYTGNFLLRSFPPKTYMLEHCVKGSSLNSNIHCIETIKDIESKGTITNTGSSIPVHYVSSDHDYKSMLMGFDKFKYGYGSEGVNVRFLLSMLNLSYTLEYNEVKKTIDKMMLVLLKKHKEHSKKLQEFYLTVGRLEYKYKHYDIAEKYFNEVLFTIRDLSSTLSIDENKLTKNEDEDAAYHYLAQIYSKKAEKEEKTKQLLSHILKGIEEDEKSYGASDFELMGDLTINNNPSKALTYYSKAENILLEDSRHALSGPSIRMVPIRQKIANALIKNGKHTESYTKIYEAYKELLTFQVNLSNEFGNEGFSLIKQNVMETMLEAAALVNMDTQKMYQIMSINKNETIVSSTQVFDMAKNNNSIDKILKELAMEKEKLSTSNNLIIKDKIKKQENQLHSLAKTMNYLTVSNTILDSDTNSVPKDTTILDFYSSGNSYFAFVISKGSLILKKIGSKDVIDTKIKNSSITYEDIMKDINILTPNLLIIPTGHLYDLSFETLKQNNTFLIEKYDIRYLNSIALLSTEIKNVKNDPSVTLFANPDFDSNETGKASEFRGLEGTHFSSLPGTALEVAKITDILKKSNIHYEAYEKEKANEITFMQHDFSGILHLATHGFFDAKGKEFENSGIVLSGVNKSIKNQNDNGIITSKKILAKDFSAVDLVVLSACDTGRGSTSSTKGVESLGTAFLLSGAKAVIISLEKISDNDTAILMKEFYKNLYIEKQNIHDAFRNAKLALKKKGMKPSSWGSMIIYG